MQLPWARTLNRILDDTPTVGGLVDLSDENYECLSRIAPNLREMTGKHCSSTEDHTDLHLEVLEQAKYTTDIHLTYFFDNTTGEDIDPAPDAVLRVYHDAKQVEVMNLNQHILPLERLFEAPGLQNKWRVSLFVSKWLRYCEYQKHHF